MGGALHCGISDTVRFVFGDLNYHNQLPIKDNGRSDAYGCVYHTQPECAEGCVPSRTLLGALYILLRVSNLFVLLRGQFLRPKCRSGQQEIPSFFSALLKPEVLNPLTLGYQSDHLLLTDAQNSVDMNE